MLTATLQYCCILAEKQWKENHAQSSSSAPFQSAETGKRLTAIQGEDRVRIRLGDTLALLTNVRGEGTGWRQRYTRMRNLLASILNFVLFQC
jgi:hypothetical protein